MLLQLVKWYEICDSFEVNLSTAAQLIELGGYNVIAINIGKDFSFPERIFVVRYSSDTNYNYQSFIRYEPKKISQKLIHKVRHILMSRLPLAHEDGSERFSQVLSGASPREILIIVGPEGGISDDEVAS